MKLVYISAGVVNAEEDRELPGLKKAYHQAEVSTIQKDSMLIGRLGVSRKLLRKSKSVILTDWMRQCVMELKYKLPGTSSNFE